MVILDTGEHEENQQICGVWHHCHVVTSKTTVAFTVSTYVNVAFFFFKFRCCSVNDCYNVANKVFSTGLYTDIPHCVWWNLKIRMSRFNFKWNFTGDGWGFCLYWPPQFLSKGIFMFSISLGYSLICRLKVTTFGYCFPQAV
jgi:hypothetical protein